MKKLFKKLFLSLLLFLGFVGGTIVYAQEPPPTLEGNITPIVERVLGYLFPIAGVIAVIFIIQGGYMWIISAGDPSKVKQAQGTLTWAVIGLVFILIIFSILQSVLKFMS